MQIMFFFGQYDILVCQISAILILDKSGWWQLYLDCENLEGKVRK